MTAAACRGQCSWRLRSTNAGVVRLVCMSGSLQPGTMPQLAAHVIPCVLPKAWLAVVCDLTTRSTFTSLPQHNADVLFGIHATGWWLTRTLCSMRDRQVLLHGSAVDVGYAAHVAALQACTLSQAHQWDASHSCWARRAWRSRPSATRSMPAAVPTGCHT
jgi:hypothetical protein